MKLVYKCLHCGQAQAKNIGDTKQTPAYVLDLVYSNDWAHKRHMPHQCEPNIIGVAMCIAVIE